MAQYTCNANMAADLMPALVKARLVFALEWPRPDVAIFNVNDPGLKLIVAEANHLNMVARGITIDRHEPGPTEKWGYFDDMSFPLTSPADLREGFEPTSNLNLWEDATHQITFNGGKHWTNVQLIDGVYVACSDGKRYWELRHFKSADVVKRPVDGPVNTTSPGKRIPMAFSDPVRQRRYNMGLCTECGSQPGPCNLCGGRSPATVGDTPACSMTDTCFDSDPSVVGE